MTAVIEVREPNRPPRRVEVSGRVQVGREGQDLDLADPEVSRRHLQIDCLGDGSLTVTDLGSTNGTLVNGSPISAPVIVRPGDVVQLGQTVLGLEPATVANASAGRATAPPSAPSAAAAPAPTSPSAAAAPAPAAPDAPGVPRAAPPTPPPPRPGLDELAAFDAGAAVIRYRPGTTGERLFRSYAKDVARARKVLAGLGSEPWDVIPHICLVDPFPDPVNPGDLVTAGTVVDAERGEIWMAVSPEAPPEPPGRPLALFFGASLPAARELERLIEGYGLLVTETPSPDATLRGVDLPSLSSAQGELGTAMAHSFVTYLVGRSSRETFLRLLSSARRGAVEAAAQEIYGATLGELEEAWRAKLVSDAAPGRPGRFIRLALTYLRPHVRREVEIFVYMLLSLGFTMVFPFVTKRLFDDAIPSRDLDQVLTLLVVMGLAFVVSLVANLRRSYLSAYVSGSVVRQLRARMFAQLQALSPSWFDRHQQGDVLSRFFSDVGQVEFGISSILRDGVFQMLSVAVAAGVLLTLDLFLGALVLLGAPLVAVVYRVMAKGAMERSSAVQEQNGALFGLASENYAAQPVVKAFGLEAREIGRFERSSDRLFRSEMKLQLFGGLFGVSVNGIVTIIRLVVLGLGAWLVVDGRLTVGGLVAFISMMGEVLAPVGTLTSLGQQLQEASGALVRIDEVLDAAPEVTDLPEGPALPPLEQEIRLSRVVFSYTPERRALDGVDCTIPARRRVAFVGPTGAGKSSILQLLMRSYDPDDGAVLWDGQDIREASLASLRRQLGVVFQDTFVFNTTIRENIRLGRLDASDDDVEEAARAAELHEFVSSLPRGYDTVVGEQGSRLSGGQRQRLAIARALIRHPRVLLLDEATSALDPRTERLVCETLDRLPEKPTTVAVTHRLTSIVAYDLIVVVVDGRIAEQGTHDALVARRGVYATLWAEQTGGLPPVEPPFDAVSALARVPLFRSLGREDLSALAARLRPQELSPGESVPEGGGTILLVRRGRARVRRAGLAGERVVVAELGPGDSFGVSALLGEESEAVLEPIEPTTLLVLDDAAIAAAARALPDVADALERRGADGVAPAGGQRLSRMSVALPLASSSLRPPIKPVAAPDAADIRRSTGSVPVVAP